MGPLAGLNDKNLSDSACRAESTGDSGYRLHETRMRRRERGNYKRQMALDITELHLPDSIMPTRNLVGANHRQKDMNTDTVIQPFDSVVGFRGNRKQRMRMGQNMVLYIQ